MRCKRCLDTRWVCENHDDKAWDDPDGCDCGAGMPCPDCNNPPPGVFPATHPGSITIWSIWTDGETVN